MLTTILIAIPLAGALALWLLPWRDARSAGGFALGVAFGTVAFWISLVANFDFGGAGLHYDLDATWFADLDAQYKVGLFDFSLWLAGLTSVVTAAAIGYALWVGRDRPRAYFGSVLFLAAATIGVFSAQDLLLFYL